MVLFLSGCPRMGRLCRGLLAAAAEDDEAEGGAVNNLDIASAAGDSPEVTSLSCLHTLAIQVFEAQLLSPGHPSIILGFSLK